MNEHDFAKMQDLFHRVWPLPPESRDGMLDAACAGQPGLKDRVLRLVGLATSMEPGEALRIAASGSGEFHVESGDLVGGYELVRWLGRGGMGQVWEARHRVNGMRVAIKLVFREAYGVATHSDIAHEFHQLKEKRHDHIVRVHDAGMHETDGGSSIPYVVMEYLPGAMSLTAHADAASLSIRRRVELFHDVCRAVAYVHESGQVHLDLKPDNMLVDASGRAFLTDFGIARPVLGWYVDKVSGTPGFMSPEHLLGDVDRIDKRADVWSLGSVLYRLLTSQDPHGLSDAASMSERLAASRQPPRKLVEARPAIAREAAELLGPLDRIARRCLEPDRERRFADAGELVREIHAVLHPGGLRGFAQEMRRERPRLARALALGAIVAVATAVGAVVTNPAIALFRLPTAWYGALLPTPRDSLQNASRLSHVTLVGFDTQTARELSGSAVPAIDPNGGRKPFRAMHAALIDELVEVGVRVIAFDLYFPRGWQRDVLLADAMRRAREAGVPVVVGVGRWQLQKGKPEISDVIWQAEPGWGGLEVDDLDHDQLKAVPLLVERRSAEPMPSLAMAVFAAHESRANGHEYASNGASVAARHYTLAGRAGRRHYPYGDTTVAVEASSVEDYEPGPDNDTGLQAGDRQFLHVFQMPPPDAFVQSTIRYEDIWRRREAVGAQLRDRVALVADIENDPGRYRTHAAAIESLILRHGTTVMTIWNYALIALGAAIAALVVRGSRHRAPAASAILLLVAGIAVAAVVMLAIAWTTRLVTGIWLNALPGLLAAALAGTLILRRTNPSASRESAT